MSLLRDAAQSLKLSARGYHRVLRVARTLADLDGAERIGRLYLAEALSTGRWPRIFSAQPGFRAQTTRQSCGNDFHLRFANHKAT